MKRLLIIIWFIISGVHSYSQKLQTTHLRCAYRVNPLGIEATHPSLSWELQSTQQNVLQTAYRILVADDSLLLQQNKSNMWDSEKIIADASIQVAYKGKALLPAGKYFWKVMVWDNKGNVSAWSAVASWQMGMLTAKDWNGAQWIAYEKINDTAIIYPHMHGNGKKAWGPRLNTLPLLRKEFRTKKNIKRATVFVCGLGQFEMHINGKKVGDHFLDPGWTDYSKRSLYVAFDVTGYIQPGYNAIGIMLGNGFYYIPGQRYRKMTGAYGLPKMIMNTIIEYTDGTKEKIVSDASWKTSPSPVIFSGIFGGEDYDATLEQKGWNEPSFNDENWKQVVIVDGPPELEAQEAEPIKVIQRFTPVDRTILSTTSWVYDLGQNFSGIPSITVSGNRGDTIKITPAELVHEGGTANQRGSGGPHYYTYILKGTGKESWHPRFTYYGFRYLQVECMPGNKNQKPPVIENIEGLHIRNAARSISSFYSSSQLFNKTFHLIDWAIKSNTMSVFTDCPHREKLGWLEQTHLMGASVQYNYAIAGLCKKVISDMRYAQNDSGKIPEIAPEFTAFSAPFDESPEWGSAAIVLPWYNYQWYGDKETLAGAYEMMQGYISYLQSKAQDNIVTHGLGDWYDIGPNRPGFSQLTTAGVTATAMYYHDLTIMEKVAGLLGKPQDARQYNNMAAAVKKSFNKKFFNTTTHQYATGSQTSNAMALYMGLVEQPYRAAVTENLVQDIRRHNNALTAGDIGYRYVLKALEEAGRSDVIMDMNNRDDVPGYGYQLKQGATALTESWQALPSVSNNHFMLGHLMEWFFAGLCGITQASNSVAFKQIEIRPQPVRAVDYVQASFHSPYGLIKSGWKKNGNRFELKVTIPANTTAEIYLPGSKQAVKVGSGTYAYSVKIK